MTSFTSLVSLVWISGLISHCADITIIRGIRRGRVVQPLPRPFPAGLGNETNYECGDFNNVTNFYAKQWKTVVLLERFSLFALVLSTTQNNLCMLQFCRRHEHLTKNRPFFFLETFIIPGWSIRAHIASWDHLEQSRNDSWLRKLELTFSDEDLAIVTLICKI